MKKINTYINEKLTLNSQSKLNLYKFYPTNFDELRNLIKQLLKERGKDADLNDIDVSSVTNMNYLFEYLDPHNIDISKWNVSNVIDMSHMFNNCHLFTGQGLENWKPIKCNDMHGMFFSCYNFNRNLSNWNVSSVIDMTQTFWECINFEGQGLNKWNVTNIESMESMFFGCKKLNINLDKWNVQNECCTTGMFDACVSLKNIPSWYKE